MRDVDKLALRSEFIAPLPAINSRRPARARLAPPVPVGAVHHGTIRFLPIQHE